MNKIMENKLKRKCQMIEWQKKNKSAGIKKCVKGKANEKKKIWKKKREIDSKIKIRIWNECKKENKNEKNGLFRLLKNKVSVIFSVYVKILSSTTLSPRHEYVNMNYYYECKILREKMWLSPINKKVWTIVDWYHYQIWSWWY